MVKKDSMKKIATPNSTFAIGGVSYSTDSFSFKESLVLSMNICAEKPGHRKSAKRYPFLKHLINQPIISQIWQGIFYTGFLRHGAFDGKNCTLVTCRLWHKKPRKFPKHWIFFPKQEIIIS